MSKKKEAPQESSMDILELYARIKKFNDTEMASVDNYRNSLNEVVELLINAHKFNLRPRMVNKLCAYKRNLEMLIQEHENLQYFDYEIQHILEKYHILNNKTMTIPFFNVNKKILKDHQNQKEQIKKEFLDKLREYTSLRQFELMIRTYTTLPKSSPPPCVCGNKTEFIKDDDRAVCALCSAEQSLICNTSSFSDVGRVNMASKYTYNRKVHFRDCIIQYQGKQKTHIPEEIYTLLQTKLQHLDQEGNSLINTQSSDKRKRYEKVSRALVLTMLKELDLKKFYDDIVLIHHTLTGQKCDNIEYLEDALLEDFDKLTETYDNLYTNTVDASGDKPTKRKNFINAQFVLYQLLKKHGHPCNEMDFITLKTSERKRFHHTICKELFSILGWKYSYSI
jgi:hypothetical protein